MKIVVRGEMASSRLRPRHRQMVAMRTWPVRWHWSRRSRPPFSVGAGAPTRSRPRPTGTAAGPMPATASLRSRLSDKVIEASSHQKEAVDGHPEAEDGSPKEHQARADRAERPRSWRPGAEEISGAQYPAAKSDAGADLCLSQGTHGAAQ